MALWALAGKEFPDIFDGLAYEHVINRALGINVDLSNLPIFNICWGLIYTTSLVKAY